MASRRIPSLNWLRVFETAARRQSFSKAAEALNMSPPAVSQQIRALEAHLGRPLFERSARSVRLTAAGRDFLPTVTRALTDVEIAASDLFDAHGRAALTIRATTLFALGWLAPRLPAFAAAHPEVRLHLHGLDAPGAAGREPSDAEVRILFGAEGEAAAGATALFGERLYPVATAAVASRISSLDALQGETLIDIASHRAGWRLWLSEQGADAEDAPPPAPRRLYADSTPMAFSLAAAGLGVALARAPASDGLLTASSLTPVLGAVAAPGYERYWLAPIAPGSSPAVRQFCAWLTAAAEAEARV